MGKTDESIYNNVYIRVHYTQKLREPITTHTDSTDQLPCMQHSAQGELCHKTIQLLVTTKQRTKRKQPTIEMASRVCCNQIQLDVACRFIYRALLSNHPSFSYFFFFFTFSMLCIYTRAVVLPFPVVFPCQELRPTPPRRITRKQQQQQQQKTDTNENTGKRICLPCVDFFSFPVCMCMHMEFSPILWRFIPRLFRSLGEGATPPIK